MKAAFKKQEVGGEKNLKLSSLDEVQFEMQQQWFAADWCKQLPVTPAAAQGWKRKELAGGHGPGQ